MKNKVIKTVSILILATLLIFGIYLFFLKDDNNQSRIEDYDKIVEYEALVVLRSQSGGTPEEDRANNLKRGDVIALQLAPIEWSKTEKASYLIVRLKDKKGEILKLLEQVEKKGEKMEGTDEYETITIQVRKYYIDIEKTGFTGNHTINGQPLMDKQFDAKIIKKK